MTRGRANPFAVMAHCRDSRSAIPACPWSWLARGRDLDALAAFRAERLAQHDPSAAALGPVLKGSASVMPWIWLADAFLLEASARDALGEPDAADRVVERALDLAECDRALLWFLLHPVPGLLE